MRSFLVFALACACSSSVPGDPPAVSSSEPETVIGVVAFRDARLTIRASSDGPRFDVVATDGRVLSRDLDERELALRHGELYDVYRSSYARGPDEPFLDARLDPPARQ